MKVSDVNTSGTGKPLTETVYSKDADNNSVETIYEYTVETSKVRTKLFAVDNLAKSGDYYQIPTISYVAPDRTVTKTLNKIIVNTTTFDEDGSASTSTVEYTKDILN